MRKIVIVISFLLTKSVFSQLGIWNHPELKWKYITTPHFRFIFHNGIENKAEHLSTNAELLYDLMTKEFDIKPDDKVDVVLTNYEDRSNGMATPFGHRIYLYIQPSKRKITGNLNWTERVFAHEFGHILNFYGVRRFGFYWELFALSRIPMWFIEGFAQYSGEFWDNNKSMFLKNFYISDNLLPLKKIEGFPGTDIVDSRLVYEQGHSISRYLIKEYNRNMIRDIIKHHKKIPLDFGHTVKKSLKIDEGKLYKRWKNDLKNIYDSEKLDDELKLLRQKKVDLPVKTVLSWLPSPDNEYVAIIGINDYYDNLIKLYLYNKKTKKLKIIDFPICSMKIEWNSDNNKLLYIKRIIHNGSYKRDLFEYCVSSGKKRRFTKGMMIDDPVYFDKNNVILINDKREGSEIIKLNIQTSDIKTLMKQEEGRYFYAPSISPDREFMSISVIENSGDRYVGLTELGETLDFRKISNTNYDSRNPLWRDNSNLIYISYENDIPNFYKYNIETKNKYKLTNSNFGFFNPNFKSGKIYTVTIGNGKNTFPVMIDPESNQPNNKVSEIKNYPNSKTYVEYSTRKKTEIESKKIINYSSIKSVKPVLLFPLISKDNEKHQFGFLTLSSDPVLKHNIQTYMLYGSQFDYSISYTNRTLYPTLDFLIYKSSVNNGDFLNSGKLWETKKGYSISTSIPYNSGKDLFSNHFFRLLFTSNYHNILEYDRTKDIKLYPWEGRDSHLKFIYIWNKYKPDVTHNLNPKEGHIVNLGVVKSVGGDRNYTRFLHYINKRFKFLFKRNILGIRLAGYYAKGDQIIQDKLGIGHPYQIRGMKHSLYGDKAIYGSIYNCFNLVRDLGIKLPLLYIEGNAVSIFSDFGKAWGESPIYNKKLNFKDVAFIKTVGVEFRQRFFIDTKLPFVIRFGIAAQISNIDDYKTYILFSTDLLSYLSDFLNLRLYEHPFKFTRDILQQIQRYFYY